MMECYIYLIFKLYNYMDLLYGFFIIFTIALGLKVKKTIKKLSRRHLLFLPTSLYIWTWLYEIQHQLGLNCSCMLNWLYPTSSFHSFQGTICRKAQFRYTQIVYCSLWEECKQTREWSIFHTWNQEYSGHRKLLCELSKLSQSNVFNLLVY